MPVFRQESHDYLAKTLAAGGNIQLVGLSGSGKSYFLRQLRDTKSIDFNYIYIDLDLIPNKSPNSLLDEINKYLVSDNDSHIVLLLDRFDSLNTGIFTSFYDWLAANYHQHRHHLSYIFAVSHPIIDPTQLSKFSRLANLLTQNLYFLPPLSQTDAFSFIDLCQKDLGISLTQKEKAAIYQLTGGYMQTIKRLIEARGNTVSDIHLQYHIQCLYQNVKPYLHNPDLLHKMHLTDDLGQFTNQVLVKYIATQKPQPKFVECLTAAELKAYQYLLDHKDQIVPRDELITAIWGFKSIGVSDHALDQLMLRLKRKASESNSQIKIESVRGRGHRLTDPCQ